MLGIFLTLDLHASEGYRSCPVCVCVCVCVCVKLDMLVASVLCSLQNLFGVFRKMTIS